MFFKSLYFFFGNIGFVKTNLFKLLEIYEVFKNISHTFVWYLIIREINEFKMGEIIMIDDKLIHAFIGNSIGWEVKLLKA